MINQYSINIPYIDQYHPIFHGSARVLRVARAARIINSLPELRVLVKGMATLGASKGRRKGFSVNLMMGKW